MVELVCRDVHAERFLVVGPQQTFRDLFSVFAEKLGKTPPRIKAPKTLTLFVAAFHELWCHLSGKRDGLTIETARSSHEVLRYDRNKIEKQLSFDYTPLDQILAICWPDKYSLKKTQNVESEADHFYRNLLSRGHHRDVGWSV